MKTSIVARSFLTLLAVLFAANVNAGTTACESGSVGSPECRGQWHFLWADTASTGADQFILFRDGAWVFVGSAESQFVMYYGEVHDAPIAGDWNGRGSDSIGLFNSITSDFELLVPYDSGLVTEKIVCTDDCVPGGIPITGKWSCDASSQADQVGIFYPGVNADFGRLTVWDDNQWTSYVIPGAGEGSVPVSGQWEGNADGCDGIGFYQTNTGMWTFFPSLAELSEANSVELFSVDIRNDLSVYSRPTTAKVVPGGAEEFGLIARSSFSIVPNKFSADCIVFVASITPIFWVDACARPYVGQGQDDQTTHPDRTPFGFGQVPVDNSKVKGSASDEVSRSDTIVIIRPY